MCKDHKEKNPFELKAACKDCPFRKDRSYLRPERVREIMRYMSNEDLLFPCHKTTNNEARNTYEEATAILEEELELSTRQDLDVLKAELEKELNFDQLSENLKFALINEEKICAGWLILGKKEGLILNNYRLRIALLQGLLSFDQFKNEDQIYDTVADAVNAHSVEY